MVATRTTPLVIGVTGHRVLAEIDCVTGAVDQVLRHIQAEYPDRTFVILSPLAEGADRLVAHCALANYQARLVVCLPLPVDEYLKDFASAASKNEFLAMLDAAAEVVTFPPQENRELAYRASGHYVLAHCQVLIAVWDGEDAAGQGGTGEIVADARARGLPLAWVHASRPGDSAAQIVTVTYERMPVQ